MRLSERCKLSSENLKRLLDNGLTVPVATQKGGRHAKRLLYSSLDQAWFIVVQDADDGGILTVVPLDYLKNRIAVNTAQRRSARSRVHAFENPRATRTTGSAKTSPVAVGQLPALNQSLATYGWKIRVCYTIRGSTSYKTLLRTLPEHGDPANWTTPGPIHAWLRERLIEAGIPFKTIERITAERKGQSESVDGLLEHLPMTREEIEACR